MEVESSSSPNCFFEDPLEKELGVLPGAISSKTSSGHVRKNIRVLTGDIISKAAAMLGGSSSE